MSNETMRNLTERMNRVSRRSLDGSVMMSSAEWNKIVGLADELQAARAQSEEPVAHQFWCPRKEEWRWFHGDDHYRNTVEAGYTVRALYTHPPARERVPKPAIAAAKRWRASSTLNATEIDSMANALLAAAPQPPVQRWTPCSERLPTKADRDGCHKVWGFDKRRKAVDHIWWDLLSLEEYTHWKPTGLQRPEPPE